MPASEPRRADAMDGLGPFEREIATLLIDRLKQGRDEYGEWEPEDERDNFDEALQEMIDASQYLAAQLVRLRRSSHGGRSRMPRVYTCHRFTSDQSGAMRALRRICRELVDEGCVPVCPQLLFPQFLDEATERETALRMCQELVRSCDQVRVYGSELTAGMRIEVNFAQLLGIPVLYTSALSEVP